MCQPKVLHPMTQIERQRIKPSCTEPSSSSKKPSADHPTRRRKDQTQSSSKGNLPSVASTNGALTSKQLRNRYLHRIGIYDAKGFIARKSCSDQKMKQMKTNIVKEPLKGDHGRPAGEVQRYFNHRSRCRASSSTPTHSPTSVMFNSTAGQKTANAKLKNNSSRLPKKSVSFNDTASIVPIPKRDAYSNRIRNEMYTSAAEIHENVNRNVIEFTAENWDWRQVLEDDDFFICVATGEKVHPVHAHLFPHIVTPCPTPVSIDVRTQQVQEQLQAQYQQQQEQNACIGCGAGISKHKDSFLQISRRNASKWEMRDEERYGFNCY